MFCNICNKIEFVTQSRAKSYKCCSKECLYKSKKGKNNIICCICGNEFHLKPYRIKKVTNKYGPSCSIDCINKLKSKIYMGRENPNVIYKNLNDDFFKNINTEDKAYLLGWISSDGNINDNGFNISINKKDINILETLRDIICKEIEIKHRDNKDIVSLSISSSTISHDIRKLLNLTSGKKSYIVNFPELESDELKWAFIRGVFDGDGSIHNITNVHSSPYCKITTSSKSMRNSIIEFTKIPCVENNIDVSWSGNNALDFLDKLYSKSKFRLSRKYEQYLHISTWVPSISYSRYFKNNHCSWAKTRKDAVSPSKERASDSGYDLVLLEKIKTIGKVEFYDTGIKVNPKFGYYFNLVPRSSISKTGYMLANSIGIIDRTYLGNIIVPLVKIDESSPDLVMPIKLVQLIPSHIVHFQMIEVDDFDNIKTVRGSGGFGSTDK